MTRPSCDVHARPVGVEDAHDADVLPVEAVVLHRQRFREPLALVVATALADRVDIAAIRLPLRMLLRVAIRLARGGEQEAGALRLRQFEQMVGAERVGQVGLDRVAAIPLRLGGGGEVVDADRAGRDRAARR